MTQTQIQKRIKKFRADSKETLLAPEKFFCPGCGEGFRYKCNRREHIKRCWDYKTRDDK